MSDTITRTLGYRETPATRIIETRVGHDFWSAAESCATECRQSYRQLAEDYTEAHTINASFSALPTGALAGLATSAAPSAVTSEADTQAALRQAELLGATADQRRKLRGIVEEAAQAKREAELHRAQAAQLQSELIEARAQMARDAEAAGAITDPADQRVWEIFGKAAVEADKQGYCSVYDQISREVGIPDRDTLRDAGYIPQKRYDVRTTVYLSFDVTVMVEADSESDAIDEVDSMSQSVLWDYAEDQINTRDYSSYDVDKWDAREAEVVED